MLHTHQEELVAASYIAAGSPFDPASGSKRLSFLIELTSRIRVVR